MSHTLRMRVERLLDGQYKGDQPIKTLKLLLVGHERHLAFAGLLFLIKQSPMWIMPMATRHVLDSVSGASNGGLREIYTWAFIAFLCLAQNIPIHTLYANLVSAAMRDAQRDLRSALVIRLQQLSVGFHDDTAAGRLQTKLLRDVDNIGGVLKSSIDVILSATCVILVAFSVAVIQAPVIAVFFLLAVPLACGLMFTFRSRLRTRNQAFRRDMEDVSVRMTEMIEMLPVTRAHAAEGGETARMRRQLARLTASGRRLDVTTERFAASSWVTFNSFQLLSLLFCAFLVRQHQLTVGQLVMFQAYFTMIIGLVSQTLGVLPQLTAGAESIRSIGEVLESPEVETDDDKQMVKSVQGDLKFEGVTYTYPNANAAAVDDFTLHIAPGECVALVGESGSGKSTILNLVIGFRHPTAGRILLDGVDMAKINFRSFRHHLAIVPQNTVLFSGTVRENITYGLDNISDRRLAEALERANCTEFVRRLPQGVDTVIGSHGGKLSGGQRQRIAIARALLRDPRMLILDEATSALDAHAEHLVQAAINELIVGRTTIIIAHRLATLKAADRVVVLEQGRIIEQGTWNELLVRPGSAFGKAYAVQNQWEQPATVA
jgi:ATP-binding cassette subfamily B protein